MDDIHEPKRQTDYESIEPWWRDEVTRRVQRLKALYDITDPQQRELVLNADREACKRDFFFWAENYAWITDPHAPSPYLRDIPYHPWKRQREMIKWIQEKVKHSEPALIVKGRKLGISWTCMLMIFHSYLFEQLYGAKVGSRKETLVDDHTLDSLFGKLRHLHSRTPPHLSPRYTPRFLKLSNHDLRSEIVGEATNEGFARGARRTVAVIDEFAHIHPKMQTQIWLAIESVAVSVWMPSTPNGKGNKFFDLFENLPKRCVFEMDWETDPSRPDDWKQTQVRPVGRLTEAEFAQEHECSFSAVLTGKIWKAPREGIEYTDIEMPHGDKARSEWTALGGWDFGSGPSLLSCVIALIEGSDENFVLWIDRDFAWQQTSWRVAAEDVKSVMEAYGGYQIHFGDPAGKQRESDQSSWEQNLRRGGVPLTCLKGFYGTRDGIEWMIKATQALLDDGRIKIHRRCHYLWECIDNWRRDIPDGMEVDWISRAYIPPRKDVYSHGANALMYLVAGAHLAMHIKKDPFQSISLPTNQSSDIAKVLEIN